MKENKVGQVLGKYRDPVVFFLLAVFFCTLSIMRGPDANWDLRNYHIYNPFALLNGKFGYDIVPAQLQTFTPPQLDLIYYFFLKNFNNYPALLGCILSIPHLAGAFFTFRVALYFIPVLVPFRVGLALLATLLGSTGAAALPTLAMSSSEMIPGSLCLAGLLLLLSSASSRQGFNRFGLAGFFFGVAAGLKLTEATYSIGAVVALLVGLELPLRRRLFAVVVLILGELGGFILVAGPWCLTLYIKYGNPLFPYFNKVFHSPYFSPVNFSDNRFKPADLTHAIFYPFYWALDARPLVTELEMSDPRFAIAFAVIVIMIVNIVITRRFPSAKSLTLFSFFIFSYVAWEIQFSIFRYLAPLEFLSSAIVLAVLEPVITQRKRRWTQWAAVALLIGIILPLTTYPNWGHAIGNGPAVDVRLPHLADNALVILLDSSPMAYVAAFTPKDIQFVGANNNIVGLSQDSLLKQKIVVAIHNHLGDLWGLEDPVDMPGEGEKTLKYYSLHRNGSCIKVNSNIDASSLSLCPLSRDMKST